MKLKHKMIVTLLVSAIGVVPSYASIKPAIESASNKALLENQQKEMDEHIKVQSEACASTTDDSSLASAQAKAIKKDNELASSSMNLDKIYDATKKTNCFAVLSDFPDLSVNIPSWAAIFTAVTDTLKKYATRKVCTAVNDAFEQVVGPIDDALNKVSSNGQLDLTGVVNTGMHDAMYKVDPDLGKVSPTVASSTEQTLAW